MTTRLVTAADFQPGTRVQYRNGAWATITEVRESADGLRDVAVWDDAWGGESGTYSQARWTSRRYVERVAVVGDPIHDPNPLIHERWVEAAEEAQ